MGTTIAQWLSFSGVAVTLCSRSQESLESFRRDLEKHYAGKVRRGRMSEAERSVRLERLRTGRSYEALEDASFIIECVVEDLEAKKAVFRELGRKDGAGRVLCSNTSSLSVSEIGRASGLPDQLLGTHFFQPVRFTSVVEVVPGRETSAEAVTRVETLLRSLGKTPLRVQDCPGFLVNRLLAVYLLAAARLARAETASPERIDRALREWGMQIGPFEVMKLVGVHLVLDVARRLGAAYGERFRIHELVEGIEIGSWLGNDRGNHATEALSGNGRGGNEERRAETEAIVDQTIRPLVEEALLCLGEGVASAEDIELAAVECLRLPKGPLALARERGIVLPPERHVERPVVVASPGSKGTRGGAFPSCLELQVESGVALLTLNNPPANSLTSQLLADFLHMLDRAELEGARAVVIVGAGRVFSTGVDPAELGALGSAEEYRLRSRQGQELLRRIERARAPLIAAINGLCLGGGMELALACHLRFCSTRARLGLPEVQLGIIPGLGGTQRLPRLVGVSRALDLILTGDTIDAERALQIGLVDRIVSRREVLMEALAFARRLARLDRALVDAVLRTVCEGARLPLDEGLELEAQSFGRLAGARTGEWAV